MSKEIDASRSQPSADAKSARTEAANSAAFTPGPWSLCDGSRTGFKTGSGGASVLAPARTSDDFFVLKIAELDTNVPPAEARANARLISAAPDLLSAAKAVSKVQADFKVFAEAGVMRGLLPFTEADLRKASAEAFADLNAAIAMATAQ